MPARLPVPAGDPGAEGLAVKLPDAGERHRVQDGHLARVFVRREPPAGEVGELRRGGLAAGPQRHECHDLLAEALVGPAATPAIATAGWPSSTSSTSRGKMLKPPRM